MQLNTLQCTRRPLTTKNYLVQNVKSAQVGDAALGILIRYEAGS